MQSDHQLEGPYTFAKSAGCNEVGWRRTLRHRDWSATSTQKHETWTSSQYRDPHTEQADSEIDNWVFIVLLSPLMMCYT